MVEKVEIKPQWYPRHEKKNKCIERRGEFFPCYYTLSLSYSPAATHYFLYLFFLQSFLANSNASNTPFSRILFLWEVMPWRVLVYKFLSPSSEFFSFAFRTNEMYWDTHTHYHPNTQSNNEHFLFLCNSFEITDLLCSFQFYRTKSLLLDSFRGTKLLVYSRLVMTLGWHFRVLTTAYTYHYGFLQPNHLHQIVHFIDSITCRNWNTYEM